GSPDVHHWCITSEERRRSSGYGRKIATRSETSSLRVVEARSGVEMRVANIVREVCANCRSKIHAVRFAAVVAVVEALVEVGRLLWSALGRGINSATAPKHSMKRGDRLVRNRDLWAEMWVTFDSLSRR